MPLPLRATRSRGAAVGDVGSLDVSLIDVGPLEAATATLTRLGSDRTEEASRWLASANIVREVRLALQCTEWGDWASLEGILEGISVNDVLEDIRREVQTAIDEVKNRSAAIAITASLGKVKAKGPVGALDKEHMDADELQKAIDAADALSVKSVRVSKLLQSAHLVLVMRRGLIADDFTSIIAAVKRINFEIDEAASEEVQRVLDEVDNYQVVRDLSGALAGNAGVPMLNRAIRSAVDVGCATPEAQRLLVTAYIVRNLRLAIAEDDDELIGAALAEALQEDVAGNMLHSKLMGASSMKKSLAAARKKEYEPTGLGLSDIPKEEIMMAIQEFNDRKAAERLKSVMAVGGLVEEIAVDGTPIIGNPDVSGVNTSEIAHAIDEVQSIGACSTKFSTALLTVATALRTLRKALVNGDWEEVSSALARCELLASGGKVDDDGESTQLVETRSRSLSAAGSLYPTMKRVAAENARELRLASEIIRAEVAIVKSHLEHRQIFEKLTASLSSGFYPNIEVEELDTAISFSEKTGCKTKETMLLLSAARYVRKMRNSMKMSNYGSASEAYEDLEDLCARDELVREVVSRELELVKSDIQNHVVTDALLDALLHGGPVGATGALITATIDASHLLVCLEKADKCADYLSHDTRRLIEGCRIVSNLRIAASQDAWTKCKSIIRNGYVSLCTLSDAGDAGIRVHAVAQTNLSIAKFTADWMPSPAREEAIKIWCEAKLRIAQSDLISALSSGSAKTLGGYVDISTVHVDKLQAAVDGAQKTGCPNVENATLLASAIVVCKLRKGLLQGSWKQIGAALSAHDAEHDGDTHEAAVVEIEALRREHARCTDKFATFSRTFQLPARASISSRSMPRCASLIA